MGKQEYQKLLNEYINKVLKTPKIKKAIGSIIIKEFLKEAFRSGKIKTKTKS